MPRKTAEQMFATQGFFRNENKKIFADRVTFTKKSDTGFYDIYINSEGEVDAYYSIVYNNIRHWGEFKITDVALKRCIKRYKEELKCR